ncbi:MAG: hypothetical protein EOO24_04080 [Comamonadaceae bacterium]|nr:MAG: hypothetical protein EOO24_04080 [Comamonadaceae bacterium]
MLNLMHLAVGQKLLLRNGAVAEIVDNLGDGIWLQMRMLSLPDGAAPAEDEELVHCEEIAGLAP